MYSISSKSLPFTSISYVQESYKLNEVNHGQKCFSLLVVFLRPIILPDFRWHKNALHFSVRKIFAHYVESGTSEKVLQ